MAMSKGCRLGQGRRRRCPAANRPRNSSAGYGRTRLSSYPDRSAGNRSAAEGRRFLDCSLNYQYRLFLFPTDLTLLSIQYSYARLPLSKDRQADMDIYKSFFEARGRSRKPVAAHIDGKNCWLAHEPAMVVTESVSFRALLRSGPSDTLTRSFELGTADAYHCVISRGIGADPRISLYTSEQQARRGYEDRVRHHDQNSLWERV